MTPASAFGWFLQAWLFAIAVLIAYRMLTGQISTAGLFTTRHGHFSPERAQLLFVTVGALTAYVAGALQTRSMDGVSNLVSISDLFTILTASHTVFLAGKSVRH
jgi:hypothetical protein